MACLWRWRDAWRGVPHCVVSGAEVVWSLCQWRLMLRGSAVVFVSGGCFCLEVVWCCLCVYVSGDVSVVVCGVDGS